ncbi:putative terminase large subunit [Erwinia phage vB_EamM_Stratton]|uniref:Terminase large subunit n=2 Tax=Erskinevirus EaH2 TaxID=2169883 RepID=J7KHL6_9CAUD|nr:terminase large subunit [Erwinia phage phiEaH2]AFQ96723.1 terminase large subunit [Erwinia phage phiEaH2]ANZ50705.1 putative terminase large subunit [Erwinia phage vB_EamM_Stratton]
MILRESDWGYYPGSLPDDTTPNKSFKKFASLLNQLGVKHYYVHLALHNRDLLGVDPFSPDLTLEQKAAIITECAENPWYFFRECVRVPADGMKNGLPFRIDRGNFSMYWIFFNNIDAAVEFLRQHGKTVGMSALLLWLMRFLENSRTILVTKGPALREETINKMKQLRNGLPDYLWPHHPDDPDNRETFACLAQGNKLITGIGQNDAESANGVGRGLTAGRLFGDEGPFTKNIHHILPAALASGTAARRINEAEGVPYGNVFATTPGDLATEEGAYMYELMTSGIMWDERYIDIPSRTQLIDIIRKGSTAKIPRIMFYVKYNHRQLGTTDEELADMIANAPGTPDQIRRDFGGEWTTGGFNKPFSGDDARRMNASRMRAVYKDISPSNYVTDWYYTEEEMITKLHDRHIIGLDTSEAVGRDAIAMSIVNSMNGEYAGKLTVNETNVIGFAIHLADFMVRYPNTVLILERRSTGSSVADAIILQLQSKVPDLHRRLYVKVTQDYARTHELYKEYHRGPVGSAERFWDKFRKYIGFSTDQDKRRKLYGEVFTMALRLTADTLRSGELIDQILSLVERNGRIDHKASGHDDLVVSWLLAMWLILFGNNLGHYGISNSRLMMRNRNLLENKGDFDEEEQVEEEEKQQKLMGEIEEAIRYSAGLSDPVQQMASRNRLQSLIAQLNTDTRNVASMESLKELIQRQRMK